MKKIYLMALVLGAAAPARAEGPDFERLLQAQKPAFSAFAERARVARDERLAVEGSGVFGAENWASFPPPDPQTLAWLVARIPGLDAAAVRVVSAEAADAFMRRAVDARTTYLDFLSDEVFRRKEIYYAPADVLNAVHRKYVSGTMPVQGRSEKDEDFQMQALVMGQGRVDILYDRDGFTFAEGDQRFKIERGGRVTAIIQGAGDIGLEGLSAYGVPIFCPWANIQRMTKESMYKVRVETNCGSRDGNDLSPVRLR